LPADWIKQRDDSDIVGSHASEYARHRQNDLLNFHVRLSFSVHPIAAPNVRRARSGKNVSQMLYARKGVVTPEVEFVA
jgi:phosphomethylpyrimidine synthase